MRSRALVLSLGLALLLTALPMLAQIPTGTISGKVTSAEGRGAAGGDGHRLLAEPAGQRGPPSPARPASTTFRSCRRASTRSASSWRGSPNPKRSVKISAAQAIRLDAELANAAVSEEIVVTGTYETISTTPEAATTYEKEFIESLPIERNIRETVLLTPGVSATGPGGARIRGISIAGSQSYENLFLVNGVVVNENLRGQPFDLFIEDAIEETTHDRSGVSAEYGRFSGGVVNTITKSGGNEFHGSFRTSFTNQNWEAGDPGPPSPDGQDQPALRGHPRRLDLAGPDLVLPRRPRLRAESTRPDVTPAHQRLSLPDGHRRSSATRAS